MTSFLSTFFIAAACLLFLCLLPKAASGFLTPVRHLQYQHPINSNTNMKSQSSRLYYSSSSSSSSSSNEVHMNVCDLERARAEFEALLEDHGYTVQPTGVIRCDADANADDQESATQVTLVGQAQLVLTSTGRRLRELELELLSTLKDSDAAVEELIHLWTTERDETAATSLMGMQTGTCSVGLVQEEEALRSLCLEYPGWAEPYSRLATLLYYKGHIKDAVIAAEQAASIKPWHFEALQVCVLILKCNSHAVDDSVKARAVRLARKSLPKLEDKDARYVWVARAVTQAARQVQLAEEASVLKQQKCHYSSQSGASAKASSSASTVPARQQNQQPAVQMLQEEIWQ